MHPHRRDSFFGRRKGKPLRPGQRALMDSLLPRLRIAVAQPSPDDPADLFPGQPGTICLEIGFGGGEQLTGRAAEHPEWGFIGVEPFENGMAKALAAIDRLGLENVRLFDRDAAFLLAWLPPDCLDCVDLLYPDPWPKKRHWKRRFVNRANVDHIARVLRPGGLFRFASDIDTYVNWTLQRLAGRDDLVWQATTADDWRKPWPGWSGTRYEAKAIREGRMPAYLTFRKV